MTVNKVELQAEEILERFRSYCVIETTSLDDAKEQPSNPLELNLARKLVQELTDLGLEEIVLTEYGYVTATLPANTEGQPVIGLLAHMDTSNECNGKDVKVLLHKDYAGGNISLNENTVLSPADFPELEQYVGQDIITSDGTTLLGADDKAGVAAIMTALKYFVSHPELKHGKLRIAFTPDEEIGRGTEHFPLEDFGADFAYTIDGGEIGELNYETFNATNVHVTFHGVSVHPGTAKNKMRNAVSMAAEWQMLLPAGERPEYTELYEGFYHTLRIVGGTDRVDIDMILRDHDASKLAERKQVITSMVEVFNAKYGAGAVEARLVDSYPNMRQFIEPVYHIVERAVAAMAAAGVEAKLLPIRGGTDGSRLSELGLPCPNIFTGGHNFHGRFEYIPLQSLVKCCEVVIRLASAEA